MIYFNSKRCDYEEERINYNELPVIFQFQKVRLWENATISKRQLLKYFNSKRCDYEKINNLQIKTTLIFQFQKVRLWVLPSNGVQRPSKFQFQKVRLWVPSLAGTNLTSDISIPKGAIMRNLKAVFGAMGTGISIPKGAIMSVAQVHCPAPRCHFNSKRCDYESQQIFTNISLFYFNSKRCDYEIVQISTCRSWHHISIPKGAIMSFGWCNTYFKPH